MTPKLGFRTQKQAVASLLDQGKTARQIADILGVRMQSVYRDAARMGMTVPRAEPKTQPRDGHGRFDVDGGQP